MLPNAGSRRFADYRGDRHGTSARPSAGWIRSSRHGPHVPLDNVAIRTLRFVVANRCTSRPTRTPLRTDVPLSERAVFEAVVNAVVHARLRGVRRIRCSCSTDRLELYSPGGLCNSMTTDDLRRVPRNELLASRLGQCPVRLIVPGGGRGTSSNDANEPSSRTRRSPLPAGGRSSRLVGERGTEGRSSGMPGRPNAEGVAASVVVTHWSTRERRLPRSVDVLMLSQQDLSRGQDLTPSGAPFELHAKLRAMTVLCGRSRSPRRPMARDYQLRPGFAGACTEGAHASGAGRRFADHRQRRTDICPVFRDG